MPLLGPLEYFEFIVKTEHEKHCSYRKLKTFLIFGRDSLKHVRRTEKCWRLFGDNVGILSVTLEKKSMWKKAFPAPSIMHSAKGYVIEALIIFHSSPNMANLDPWLTTIGKRRLKYYLDRLEKMEGFPHFMEIQFCCKWL